MTVSFVIPALPWWAWALGAYGVMGVYAAVRTGRLKAVALWPLYLLVMLFGVVQ